MYKIVGYYIVEKITAPDYLEIECDEMITVSECFSEIHPDLTYCYFSNNRKKERVEYCKKWNIDEDKALKLQEDIDLMFQNRIAIDGRFLRLEDAKRICKEYFDSERCVIVSVSTTEEYYQKITDDIMENSNSINDFFTGILDENEFLGYDILGWDCGGFHTFLCNSLHKNEELLKFNKYCLLENDFGFVEDFAKQIQGKGEPVEWIPCRIGKCE
ncbi:MAG: hypothetical protein IKK33_04590 [Lachnospiraceae bacterium]|nr:hypothetical protein [Lachnospiraceae bacterium]